MREDINSWRSDARERSAMVEALEEINDALDREDWVTAESQCQAATGNWPDWHGARETARALKTYLEAYAGAKSARRRPPPPDASTLHVAVDDAALPSARAARLHHHASADILRLIFGFLLEGWDGRTAYHINHEGLSIEQDAALVAQPRRFADCGAGWTRDRLETLALVRQVSSAWRDAAPYSSLKCITVRTDWDLPADFGQRFCGVERLNVTSEKFLLDDEGEHHYETVAGADTLHRAIASMPRLRVLSLDECDIKHMPDWLRSLPLEELQVSTTDFQANAYPWDRDEDCLPRSLKIFRHDDRNCNASLACLRQLTQLEEVHLGSAHCPSWLGQLPNLKRVHGYLAPIHSYADALQGVALEVFTLQIPFEHEDFVASHEEYEFADPLERLLSSASATLQSLDLHGHHLLGIDAFPRALRDCRLLRKLDLDKCEIQVLPEWIGELPLVVLDLTANYGLEDLPLSMQSCRTLRLIKLRLTCLSGPYAPSFEADDEDENSLEGRVCLLTQEGTMPLEEVSTEELNRRRAALMAISRALPDLRLELHHAVRGGRCVCWREGDKGDAGGDPQYAGQTIDPLDPHWAMEPASDSESDSDAESEHEMACGPLLAAAFEPLEQTFHYNRDELADDVKQSLLDLDDETAAACVQAFFDALQRGPITMETGKSPVDWLRERIAEVNAPETPAPAPASAPSLCSVA